jgi:hypothetical protein
MDGVKCRSKAKKCGGWPLQSLMAVKLFTTSRRCSQSISYTFSSGGGFTEEGGITQWVNT